VREWLKNLKLSEYEPLFHSEGYKEEGDMENLKELDTVQLKKLGITKKGADTTSLKIPLSVCSCSLRFVVNITCSTRVCILLWPSISLSIYLTLVQIT
jgi:hypothetical protein